MTERDWSHAGFAALADRVGDRVGLRFPANQRARAEAEVRRAMTARSVTDPDRYRVLVEHDEAAFSELVGRLTVGESYFFRDPGQLEIVRTEVLPSLLRGRIGRGPLRAWSAGCACGEEAYSLAILFREERCDVRIVGTDVSSSRLEKARRGRYTDWALRAVQPDVAQRYFARSGRCWDLQPSVRVGVEFRYLNLAEQGDPVAVQRMSGMDLVFCRNVLIYLTEEAVARAARRLLDSLSADGWLFLGASDPPLADLVPCEVVVTNAGVAYRRAQPSQAAIPAPLPIARPPEPAGRAPDPVCPPSDPVGPPSDPVSPPHRQEPLQPAPARWVHPLPAATEETDLPGALARAYADRDYPRAAELAAHLVRNDGDDPAPWAVLVRSLANRGNLEEAGKACAAALDRHPTSAELAYLHTVLLTAAGRHSEAVAAARRALYLDSRMIVAHVALATACTRTGELAVARRALRNAQRLLHAMPPDDPVPVSDGERAGRLIAATRLQLRVLGETAA